MAQPPGDYAFVNDTTPAYGPALAQLHGSRTANPEQATHGSARRVAQGQIVAKSGPQETTGGN